jgi:hypothetical protein
MTFYSGAFSPLSCGRGVDGEKGQVIPEVHFTLPSLETGENNPCLRTRLAVVAVIRELKGASERRFENPGTRIALAG